MYRPVFNPGASFVFQLPEYMVCLMRLLMPVGEWKAVYLSRNYGHFLHFLHLGITLESSWIKSHISHFCCWCTVLVYKQLYDTASQIINDGEFRFPSFLVSIQLTIQFPLRSSSRPGDGVKGKVIACTWWESLVLINSLGASPWFIHLALPEASNSILVCHWHLISMGSAASYDSKARIFVCYHQWSTKEH